ncbi:MAG TPA: hypothetical protein VJ739_17800 [Gemmataceae bacterium]|nr:hypothetical protein [Gemmataceae bacterium]
MSKPTTKTKQATSQHTPKKEEDLRGEIIFEKEDVALLYRALRAYQPREQEAQRHELLVEQFEEILAVDFELLEVPY